MAVTLGSTGITFPDATTQTTAATGGGSVQATFTTSAATTAGQVMVFSDSTASTVAPVTGSSATANAAGNNTVISPSSNNGLIMGSAFDPNTAGSFVAFTYNANGQINIRAGTLVTNTTTMGTVLNVSTAGTGNNFCTPKIMFDPVTAGKCMLIACDDTNNTFLTRAWIFTVSSNAITLQSTTTLYSTNATATAFSYYGQDVFCYSYITTGGVLTAVACSISTYTITQGTATTIATGARNVRTGYYWGTDMDYARAASANKLAIAYIQDANRDMYTSIFTVVPATKAITAGTTIATTTGDIDAVTIAWDPVHTSNLAIASLQIDAGSTTAGRYAITSGTGFSSTTSFNPAPTSPYSDGSRSLRIGFGTTSDVSSGSVQSVLQTFFSGGTYATCCENYFRFYGRSFTFTSGGTVTNGAYVELSDQLFVFYTTGIFTPIPNQPNKFPFVYKLNSTTVRMLLNQIAYTYSNLTSASLIGIANASASSGASVLVNVLGGISTNQTGLTTQSTYYVTQTGTLTTSSASPNVSVGRAISATSLLIKGLTI